MTIYEMLRLAQHYVGLAGAPEHFYTMLPQMERVADKENPHELALWLGFMQGVLWENGTFTLDELRAHNENGVPA